MAHESFEDPATAEPSWPIVRLGQGRPRGAARHRRRLHGRRAGHDGSGGLADVRVLHARRSTLLRAAPTSHPSDRHGMPSFRRVVEAAGRGLGRPTDRGRAPGRRVWPTPSTRSVRLADRLAGARARRGGGAGGGPGAARRRWWTTSPTASTTSGADSGRPPSSPGPTLVELCLRHHRRDRRRPRRTPWPPPPSTPWPPAGSTTTGRRLRPLLHRPPVAGAPLREDAHRPGPAGPGLPARLAGHRVTATTSRWSARPSTTSSATSSGTRRRAVLLRWTPTPGVEEGAHATLTADQVGRALAAAGRAELDDAVARLVRRHRRRATGRGPSLRRPLGRPAGPTPPSVESRAERHLRAGPGAAGPSRPSTTRC